MADNKKVIEIIGAIADKIEEQRDYLTKLDGPVGDSDHGINMARGFSEVRNRLPSLAGKDIGTILKTTGMTLMSKVGGASGPLYGSAFMKAGIREDGKSEIGISDFADCLDTAVDAVGKLGHAGAGEATMLDAMIPAAEAVKKELERGETDAKTVLSAASRAAWDGVEKTKNMIATKGRASYVGERGIGHQDPGATSFAYMLDAVRDSL